MEWLKDGIVLCKLVNKINKGEPDYKKKWKCKFSKSKMPFTQRENICNYIETCKRMGMEDIDCFVSQDLYDGDNPVKVVGQINGLGALAKNVKSYDGPQFGVAFAQENKRTFDAETIKKGKCFVPLQNAGSIAVDKGKGTDHIVQYGKVGQEMGQSVGGVSQQNAGSIQVEKEKGTDHIVRYGKVGQEMGESSGGTSQLNEGSIARDKGNKLDNVSRALN